MEKAGRRIAAAEIIAEGNLLHQCVVEITHSCVRNLYPIDKELPMTEWTESTITLKRNDKSELQAFINGELIHD